MDTEPGTDPDTEPGTDQLLIHAIIRYPMHWLGDAHITKYSSSTKLLVKLLDAGQHLPVHAHPHERWVRQNLEKKYYGKAEAWYILTPGVVYLGLKEDTPVIELKALTLAQDPRLLDRLHRIEVKPGDAVYVPPGYLHAIGEGVMIVEVQEPADLSILLEWTGFDGLDGMRDGHLGVGWDKALTAVDVMGHSLEEIQQLIVTKEMRAEKLAAGDVKNAFTAASEEYFRLDEILLKDSDGLKTLEQSFSLVIVLEGSVTLTTFDKFEQSLKLTKGNTVLLAYGDGEATLRGNGHIPCRKATKVVKSCTDCCLA